MPIDILKSMHFLALARAVSIHADKRLYWHAMYYTESATLMILRVRCHSQHIFCSTGVRLARHTPQKARRAYPVGADGRRCRTPKVMTKTR